ncbi:uncharacterized protein LOC130957950 [Arachis stenosperma]|uniref:uncharacterized protein LOC130957950 n=1 Tax=Arachis stenosperma TaxID=217475 RepID=UPI0025AB959A|nr:uncharacterized protein LOC130957950 [Arachis stenosperma]
MDMKKNWLSTSVTNSRESIRLGRSYTKPHYRSYYSSSPSGNNNCEGSNSKRVWKIIWSKLKRDKKKVYVSPAAATARDGVYDPETYSMNFDHGMGWMEPDNLPRSFSARYADPSRLILPPKDLLT